jgi:hypothetical protein
MTLLSENTSGLNHIINLNYEYFVWIVIICLSRSTGLLRSNLTNYVGMVPALVLISQFPSCFWKRRPAFCGIPDMFSVWPPSKYLGLKLEGHGFPLCMSFLDTTNKECLIPHGTKNA